MKKRPSLLIVDDRWLMRQTITAALREMGYTDLSEATSGLEAMRMLQNKATAAVISDWDMPGMNGLGLLRWMRSKPEFAETPFMMITAESSREQVRMAVEAGVSSYMVKPFTVQDLANKIERILGQERQIMPVPSGDKVLGLTNASDVEDRIEGSTILVVDDVPSNSEVIAEILKDEYTVLTATSGLKALDIARSEDPPHLILLDIIMPELDGYDVCRRLKEQARTRDIPIIFLTGNDQVEDVVKGLEMGAVDYITKPAEPSILKARIRTHLRLKRAFDGIAQQNASLSTSAKLKEDVDRMTQHDLINPLSAIIGSTDLVLKDITLNENTKKILQHIHSGAWRTLDLVNQSLSLYQMETGAFILRPEAVDIAATLVMIRQETLTAFSELALDIRLTAKDGSKLVPGKYRVKGERGLCYSLFVNLLRNAAEASPKEGIIHVSFAASEDVMTVTIHNAGVVPALIRERFFDKYVTAGKERGTGLGTYSAKLVTEAMRGTIAMQTDETTGTVLTVRLPIAPEVETPSSS